MLTGHPLPMQREMIMETTKVARRTQHTVTMTLEGVEDQFQTQYGSEFKIQPDSLALRWEYDPSRGWQLMKARVTGRQVLVSGDTGKRRGGRDFEISGSIDPTAPRWLVELIALYQPSGVVLIP